VIINCGALLTASPAGVGGRTGMQTDMLIATLRFPTGGGVITHERSLVIELPWTICESLLGQLSTMLLVRCRVVNTFWCFCIFKISSKAVRLIWFYCLISLCYIYNNIICISMGGQLDGIFFSGSLPHKFILIVTSFIRLWWINFSLSLARRCDVTQFSAEVEPRWRRPLPCDDVF